MRSDAKSAQAQTASQVPGDSLGGWRFDWTMIVLSAWLLGGAYVDGWAHSHGKVDDTFFYPLARPVLLRLPRRRGISSRVCSSQCGTGTTLAPGIANRLSLVDDWGFDFLVRRDRRYDLAYPFWH